MEVIHLYFAYTIILMRFQVHAICLAFCQQATVLRGPAEKIGTIDSIGLGQCGRGSAASKRSRDCSLFLVGLQQVSYFSIFSFLLVVVLGWKWWADPGVKLISVTLLIQSWILWGPEHFCFWSLNTSLNPEQTEIKCDRPLFLIASPLAMWNIGGE